MHVERQNAYKLIAIQASIVVILSALFLFSSVKSAYSVLLGGFCCVLPSIYFAHKLFKYVGARMAKKAIGAFYVGEVIKLAMIAVISIIIFKFIHISPMSYFIGFIVAQIAFWIAPNVLLMRQAKLSGGMQ
jgi:ATP synthase protein I